MSAIEVPALCGISLLWVHGRSQGLILATSTYPVKVRALSGCLAPQACKMCALLHGIGPSREFYVRIFRIERHDKGVRSKCDVKLIKLLRGGARLPHCIQVVINDLFASCDGLIRIGKNAMIVLRALIHVMGVVINQYSIFRHSFSFLRGGR